MRWVFILLLAMPALGQSVTTVEVYGSVPAVQVYNGLGSNLTQTNAWEYAALQAIHGTWARNDCGWASVETSPGTYSMPSGCSAALTNSSTYGIHPVFNADYGPSYTAVASGTATSAVSVGATTVAITVTSGSLSLVVPGQTELAISGGFISTKHSYPGVMVTAVAGNTLTLASAATTAVASGATLTLNKLLYPPVIVAPGTSFQNNTSLQAYGNYAHYLATQIASAGLTGWVSLWNEPPWGDDAWDHGINLYDTQPASNSLSSGPFTLGIELPLYVASYVTPVAGVGFDNGYTETTGFSGSLYFPNWVLARPNPKIVNASIVSQSFHPYGNNPEDAGWLGSSCLASHISLTNNDFNSMYSGCTPTGLNTSGAAKTAVAAGMTAYAFGGPSNDITETGLCRCSSPTPSETQVSRFDLREFLMFQSLGVSPIMFYRMYGDTNFQWMSSQGNPLPVYTAFQNLMADVGSIASTPVAPYSPCMMPRVSSFTGYYPLATASFVGSQSGNRANSILYYTWQRTYGTTWTSVASPTAVNVSVVVPAGLTVSSVKDMVTAATVSYTFSSQTLTYPVADDPIEVLLVPVSSSTPATLSCT